MERHYIVCGLGQIGFRVVDLLRRLGEPVTVITMSARSEWLARSEAMGVRILIGDARDEGLLASAGIRDCAAVVAATDNDLVNIEVALDANALHPYVPVVVRLFDQTLARQLEAGFNVRRALGMSSLAAPTFAAAALGERVVGSFDVGATAYVVGQLKADEVALARGVTVRQAEEALGLTVLAIRKGDVESPAPAPDAALEPGDWLTVAGPAAAWSEAMHDGASALRAGRMKRWGRAAGRACSPRRWLALAGWAWGETSMALRSVLAVLTLLTVLSVLVFRYGMGLNTVDAIYFAITTVTTTGFGDAPLGKASAAVKLYGSLMMILGSSAVAVLYALATDYFVAARFRQLLGRQRIPEEGHTIVAGLGNLGLRIVKGLRSAGISVVVIERSADSQFVEAVSAHTPVITGDARLPYTLRKAGAERASAVIAATPDDAVNLGIVLSARQLNATARTVLRLFDAGFAAKVQTAVSVDAAISAASVAAPTFTASALYPGVLTAFVLEDRLYVLQRRAVGAEWHGKTADSLRHEEGVILLQRETPAPAGSPMHQDETVVAVLWRELNPLPGTSAAGA